MLGTKNIISMPECLICIWETPGFELWQENWWYWQRSSWPTKYTKANHINSTYGSYRSILTNSSVPPTLISL